jgi:hypothetical protein
MAPAMPRQLEAIKPPVAMDPEEFHLELKRRTQAHAQALAPTPHITLTLGQLDDAAAAAVQRAVVDLDEPAPDMMSFVQNLLDDDAPVAPREAAISFSSAALDSRIRTEQEQNEIQVLRDAMEMRMERIERTLAAIYAAIVNGQGLGPQLGSGQTASQLAAGQVRGYTAKSDGLSVDNTDR